MDIAALIISIISLFVGIGIAIYEVIENRRINNISLESVYFDSLYKDFLLKQIPIARTKIIFDKDSKLSDTDELIDILNEMRNNSLYFRYVDKDFYDKIKELLQDLEDFIMSSSDKKIAGEDQTDFFKTMQDKISAIYELMLSKYKGEKQSNLKNFFKRNKR